MEKNRPKESGRGLENMLGNAVLGALLQIAQQSDTGQSSKKDDMFAQMDVDGNGSVSKEEFVAARPDDVSGEQASNLFADALPDDKATIVRTRLQEMAPALAVAKDMVRFPQGLIPTASTRDAFSTLLPDHQAGRHMATMRYVDALLQIHESNQTEFHKGCLAILHTANAYEEEYVAMTQLIRWTIIQNAARLIERMLAQGNCTDQELAAVAQEFEKAMSVPWLYRAAQGERGAMHYFLSSLAAGDVSDEMTLEAMTGVSSKAELPAGAESRRIHAGMLRRCTEFLEITRQEPMEQAERIRVLDEQSFAASWAQSPNSAEATSGSAVDTYTFTDFRITQIGAGPREGQSSSYSAFVWRATLLAAT